MRIGLTLVLLAMPAASQASDDVTGTQTEPRDIHEIRVRGERYSFTPGEIEVVEGETVRLTLEAVDVPHGFAIADLGVRVVGRPDDEPTVVEFLPRRPVGIDSPVPSFAVLVTTR